MIAQATTATPVIKLLSVIEAGSVTGPVKNLIEFCRRARDLSRELTGLPSIETTLVTFERGRKSAGRTGHAFLAAARDAGIDVEVIAERFRFDPRVVAGLRDLFDRLAPDIVQTHNVKSHFLMRLSGLCRERPWIAFHHGYTATDLKMRAYNQLDRWSLGAAARVVTVSRAFARDLARAGVSPERIRVLHNSIALDGAAVAGEENARSLRSRLGVEDGERVVVAAGRLSREKGHADLIAALDHLRRLRPSLKVRLVIVGDGPERRPVAEAARALGLLDRVVFAGQVEDVRPYYAIADLLSLPSHSEGSPNVLLEAMAARLPVVATRVGGVPEIVTHGESALLVAPHDPRAMAEAIAAIFADAGLAERLAASARASVAARHSPEARLRSLAEIYRELAPAGLR
jgi:glycosyltransferase involved in cell wall biosynthesis